MPELRRFLPAAVLFLGCGFVWNARSQKAVPLAAPLAGILRDVQGFRVEDQKISDEERRIAGMTDYIARVYWRDSVPVLTTFVSYYERQTQGKTIHSPRNCLPGAGWDVLSAGRTTVDVDGRVHELNQYVLKNGMATAVVFYWYQGRGRVVANEYTVKWNLLRDAALAGHTEEALVRVVVPVIVPKGANTAVTKQSSDAANALAEQMAVRLIREVERVLPGDEKLAAAALAPERSAVATGTEALRTSDVARR